MPPARPPTLRVQGARHAARLVEFAHARLVGAVRVVTKNVVCKAVQVGAGRATKAVGQPLGTWAALLLAAGRAQAQALRPAAPPSPSKLSATGARPVRK